ncbi:MAG: orotate phosphoribosyltransferase [Muribaculaceae bacterium]|nr:orotate phosphoribosyltransferase [Muribaculaceae bacterium]
MKKSDRILADKLLEISAVKLQPELPFVWGSGWNSPIYNDNRRILSYPDVRNYVKVELAKTVLECYPEVNTLAAVSVAAIPFGTMVADVLGIPFVYIRSTPKDHGLENQIEGDLQVGRKVVMIEDIVATGGGSIRGAEAIRFNACDVLGGVCVFDYEFPAAVKRLRDANIEMHPLCTYDTLVEAAIEVKYIHPSQEGTLKNWRKDPANWVPEN